MKKVISKSILACLIVGNVGCADPDSAGTSSGSSTAPPPNIVPSPPVATAASPLQLQIQTIYDMTEEVVTHKFQETGTTTCEATTTSTTVTCTVAIPEARLYYSKVRFNYSWRNDKCKVMLFQPYYYVQALSGMFAPPWVDAPIDCGALPRPSDCYGGAAPELVPGFPKFTAIIQLSDPDSTAPQNHTVDLGSAYSKGYGSNRRTVNDANLTKLNALGSDFTFSAGDKYHIPAGPPNSGNYANYQFYCKDDWNDDQPYTINLVIKDVDSSGTPVVNHFRTWEEVP